MGVPSQKTKLTPRTPLQPFKRASKYGAKAVVVDGERIASKAEARRWAELRVLERAGEIADLKRQPRFPFKLNGDLMFTYIADFDYRDKAGRRVVEDVKGVATPLYKLKKKIIEADAGIIIVEVKKGTRHEKVKLNGKRQAVPKRD